MGPLGVIRSRGQSPHERDKYPYQRGSTELSCPSAMGGYNEKTASEFWILNLNFRY